MYHIIIQQAADKSLAPKNTMLKKWVKKALEHEIKSAEVTIRIVDAKEMEALNSTYRKKRSSTNVLSFPAKLPDDIALDIPLLGDIVICAEVVNQEAKAQQKSHDAHWAHMIVHGCLHLLGYDHERDTDATKMETKEIKILSELGFENPYETGANRHNE
jgi:probable rRNA maturation factor